jgi:hypothetical protein
LIAQFNEKPNFILATKLCIDSESEQGRIISCNYIDDLTMISALGSLPVLSRKSFGECEIEFINVSSATFGHLNKHRGLQMEIFEKENECSIEANI